jgi:glycosyltransferase involved in cell wall biosynthesis
MKEIKVYPILGTHPIYADLFRYPPNGISYLSNLFTNSISDFSQMNVYSKKMMLTKSIYMGLCSAFKMPRVYYVIKDCDLIHSAGVCILNRKPWIVDAEHASIFLNMEHNKLIDPKYKAKIVKSLSSGFCKKICTYSNAASNSLFNAFDCSGFSDKIETVYPSIAHRSDTNADKQSDKIVILHISNSFDWRGGKEILKAFELIDKKYDNIELIMKTRVPDEYIKKYSKYKNLYIHNNRVSREDLFKNYFLKSDIFVSLSFNDTFGYSYLEAMSAGLPLIATDIFAIPEIVENGKNGFLIHSQASLFNKDYLVDEIDIKLRNEKIKNRKSVALISQLVDKLSILIEDDTTRKKMGKNSLNLVKNGKFSIDRRNKQLGEIYRNALN